MPPKESSLLADSKAVIHVETKSVREDTKDKYMSDIVSAAILGERLFRIWYNSFHDAERSGAAWHELDVIKKRYWCDWALETPYNKTTFDFNKVNSNMRPSLEEEHNAITKRKVPIIGERYEIVNNKKLVSETVTELIELDRDRICGTIINRFINSLDGSVSNTDTSSSIGNNVTQ